VTDDHQGAPPPIVPLLIQRTPSGSLRMASPLLPGWVAITHGMAETIKALEVAIREADLARYATERGYVYDALPFVPEQSLPPVLRMVRRLDGTWNWRAAHDPAAWTPLEDGRWRSPKGHCYRGDSQVVQRVIALRRDLGLATRHPDAPAELEGS
jgi:hypothetical protein